MKNINLKFLLRPLVGLSRKFYQKYFSEVGYITREINFFINRIIFINEIHVRKKLKLNFKLTSHDLEIVRTLNEKGFVKLRLGDFGISNSLSEFLKKIASDYESTTLEQIKKSRLNASKYYWHNIYHGHADVEDPIVTFITHSRILAIASEYLDELPYIQELNFFHSPIFEESRGLIGSQAWHLDNDKKRRIKIFYSPFEITSQHGPTTVLSVKHSDKSKYPNYPGYFNDCDAALAGLPINERIEFTTTPGEFYIADTSRCYHFGSRNNIEHRFLLIAGLGPIETYLSFLRTKKYLKDKYGLLDINEKILEVTNALG
jgi:hypothetical protein